MSILAIILLIPAVASYSISELQQHGKLKWSKWVFGFWGEDSDRRKHYRYLSPGDTRSSGKWITAPPKKNWYTKLFKIKYRERWFTSTWLTVGFTDGYHFMQLLTLIFISATLAVIVGFTLKMFVLIWAGIHAIHSITYWSLHKKETHE